MAGFSEFFFGSPERVDQLQRYTPQQQSVLSQLLNAGSQQLNQPSNWQEQFAPIANQARNNFNQQTIPSLAERFSSTGGGLSSPAFASQLGQAGAGLDSSLAALGAQFGQQQQSMDRNYLMQLLQGGLQPSFESVIRPGTNGLLGNLSGSLGQGLGLLPLLLAGGGAGGAGLGIGTLLSRLLGNNGGM